MAFYFTMKFSHSLKAISEKKTKGKTESHGQYACKLLWILTEFFQHTKCKFIPNIGLFLKFI